MKAVTAEGFNDINRFPGESAQLVIVNQNVGLNATPRMEAKLQPKL